MMAEAPEGAAAAAALAGPAAAIALRAPESASPPAASRAERRSSCWAGLVFLVGAVGGVCFSIAPLLSAFDLFAALAALTAFQGPRFVAAT